MLKLQKLIFDTEIQLILFHVVLNKPKGITTTNISKQTFFPKTTIYENLIKLEKRTILVGPNINVKIPYIKHYKKRLESGKGRPNTLFYVPKLIRKTFIEHYFPDVKIKR